MGSFWSHDGGWLLRGAGSKIIKKEQVTQLEAVDTQRGDPTDLTVAFQNKTSFIFESNTQILQLNDSPLLFTSRSIPCVPCGSCCSPSLHALPARICKRSVSQFLNQLPFVHAHSQVTSAGRNLSLQSILQPFETHFHDRPAAQLCKDTS